MNFPTEDQITCRLKPHWIWRLLFANSHVSVWTQLIVFVCWQSRVCVDTVDCFCLLTVTCLCGHSWLFLFADSHVSVWTQLIVFVCWQSPVCVDTVDCFCLLTVMCLCGYSWLFLFADSHNQLCGHSWFGSFFSVKLSNNSEDTTLRMDHFLGHQKRKQRTLQ